MNTDTNDEIPVTILRQSGAGKTTLLNHLLSNAGDRRWRSSPTTWARSTSTPNSSPREFGTELDDGVAEPRTAVSAVSFRTTLETAVVRLARDRSFDHPVVESSGISEPAPVARLFTTESRVAALYDVDTLRNGSRHARLPEAFAGEERPERTGSEGRPSSADLLVEQLEVSNSSC